MQAVSIVELKSRQRGMTNILESITDGVVIYDRKWHITFVNQQGAQIVGQTPEELLGKTVWDIHPDAVGSTFYQECQRAIAQQVSVHFQEFYAPLNVWFQIHAYPLAEGLMILYQEITQRKQIEEALQRACTELEHRVLARTLQLSRTDTLLRSETLARRRAEEALQNTNEQLANIFERITDGFCAVDREWRYTYVNHKAEQILQKNQTELLGKNIWDVFPQGIGSTAYQQYHEALRTGCSVRFESFCLATERWFEMSAYPSHDGLSIYFQDITVRKRIEEERQQLLAREQEARIKAELAEQRCNFLAQASEVLASSLDYETTLNSVARLVVPFLADYCLIHRLEVDGQLRMVAAVHHDPNKQKLLNELGCLYQTDIQNSNNLMAQVARTGEAIFAAEVGPQMAQFVSRDSRLLEIKARLQPKSLIVLPLIARRQILGTLMLGMTESDRHYKESDLWLTLDLARRAAMAIDNAQLYHKAQESNRLKDEFLLTLSHELRTPLNSILGWATILLTRNLNERTLRQALETIERKARAQVQIVYDLLDVSRLMAGRLRLNPSWVELGGIINEAIATLQLAIEAKSIQLDSQVNSSAGLVRGDPKYLYRVVWNLLSNAIKFTPNGGRVEIQLMQVDNYAQIQVRDTGIGIDPDFLPHVFDRFRQADSTTTRRFGGVGLGLTLVGQLVELHGGTVQALSDGVDKGATFIVKLPLAPVSDSKSVPAQEATVDEGMLSRNVPVLEGLRVLIVDYEPDFREAIASMLAEYKAEAIAVASVNEALRALHHFKPDVVIRSNNILESDAYWLLSGMRTLCMEEGGQIPIIALTTDASEKTVVQARSAGIQMHISEPIAADELAAIVATLVGGSESNELIF